MTSLGGISSNTWWVLLGLGLSLVMLNLDLTIVNLALPVIASVFHISLTDLQWINNSFMLAYTCITIFGGYLADRFGRKKIYQWGIFIFALGSLIAGLATNSGMLIFGRFLQGLGIGISFQLVLILIGESFPENRRGMAIGLLSTFAGISQAIGPTLGGVIVQWLGWRWSFIINLPICPFIILIIWKKCQVGMERADHHRPLHIPSLITLLLGLVAIITALNQMHSWGALSIKFLFSLIGGLVLLLVTIWMQLRITNPLIDLSLFKIPIYKAVNLIRPIFQFIFFGFYFVLPLYLQNFMGYSPSQSGLIILIMSIAMGILAPIIGRSIDRIGVRLPLIMAQLCIIISFSFLAFTTAHLNLWILGFGLLFMGIATGITFPATNFAAVNFLPPSKKGLGMGVYTTLSGLFSSAGIALSGTLLSSLSLYHFNHLLKAQHLHLLDSKTIENMVTGAQPMQPMAALTPIMQSSFLMGFHAIMILYLILGILALIMCRFLKR